MEYWVTVRSIAVCYQKYLYETQAHKVHNWAGLWGGEAHCLESWSRRLREMFGILRSLGSAVDWRARGYLHRRLRVWGTVQVCRSAKDQTHEKKNWIFWGTLYSLYSTVWGSQKPWHKFVSFIGTGDLKLVPSPWELWRRSRSREFLFAALGTVWVRGVATEPRAGVSIRCQSCRQKSWFWVSLARGEVFACRVSPCENDLHFGHLFNYIHILRIFHSWFI